MFRALVATAACASAPLLGHAEPLRGISYKALPTKTLSSVIPANDLVQVGYELQWGSDGRGDLEIVKGVGANTVRMYHALGSEGTTDHTAFLDQCQKMNISVLAGFHSQGYCPSFNCFDAWKAATAKGFAMGFKKGSAWHPAVKGLILIDQPDYLNFIGSPDGAAPVCATEDQGKCRTRAVLSALDGVLAAEKEAGITGTVQLSAAWSFAIRSSMDGKVSGEAIYGFQDMVAGIASPKMAEYEPKATQDDLTNAFAHRWVHATSTGAPWEYINEKVAGQYKQFEPTPWMITEFQAGTAGHAIEDDLKAMDTAAKSGSFLGAVFNEFQHDYVANTAFGMFGLGDKQIGTVKPCYEDVLSKAKYCYNYPLYCLNATAGDGGRAASVAAAWGGKVAGKGLCSSSSAREVLMV
jgi:hypothetical protein